MYYFFANCKFLTKLTKSEPLFCRIDAKNGAKVAFLSYLCAFIQKNTPPDGEGWHFTFLTVWGVNVVRRSKSKDPYWEKPCTKPAASAEQISPPMTRLREISRLAYTLPSKPG